MPVVSLAVAVEDADERRRATALAIEAGRALLFDRTKLIELAMRPASPFGIRCRTRRAADARACQGVITPARKWAPAKCCDRTRESDGVTVQ